MSFYDELATRTQSGRARLLGAPIVQDTLQGIASRQSYLAFLSQAFHHVSQTVPLLMQMGARLPDHLGWLRDAVAEYIEEERGHDAWVLDDIRVAGGDGPAPAAMPVELMVAYAWDVVQRGNPVGFLGMVYVLEGTSVQLAVRAADCIQAATGLPDGAFRYLRSHGVLDIDHTAHLKRLVDRLDFADQREVEHRAQVFFHLYGDMFHALPRSMQETPCN